MDVDLLDELERNLRYAQWLLERFEQSAPRQRDSYIHDFTRAVKGRRAAIEQLLVPSLMCNGLDFDLGARLLDLADPTLREVAPLRCARRDALCRLHQQRFMVLIVDRLVLQQRELVRHLHLLPDDERDGIATDFRHAVQGWDWQGVVSDRGERTTPPPAQDGCVWRGLAGAVTFDICQLDIPASD